MYSYRQRWEIKDARLRRAVAFGYAYLLLPQVLEKQIILLMRREVVPMTREREQLIGNT